MFFIKSYKKMKEESFLSSQDEEAGRNSRVIVRVAGYGRLQKKLIPAAPGRRRKRRESDGKMTAGIFGGFERKTTKTPVIFRKVTGVLSTGE